MPQFNASFSSQSTAFTVLMAMQKVNVSGPSRNGALRRARSNAGQKKSQECGEYICTGPGYLKESHIRRYSTPRDLGPRRWLVQALYLSGSLYKSEIESLAAFDGVSNWRLALGDAIDAGAVYKGADKKYYARARAVPF